MSEHKCSALSKLQKNISWWLYYNLETLSVLLNTGPFCGEFIVSPLDSIHKWSLLWSFDFVYVVILIKLFNKQSNCWWLELTNSWLKENMPFRRVYSFSLHWKTCSCAQAIVQYFSYGLIHRQDMLYFKILSSPEDKELEVAGQDNGIKWKHFPRYSHLCGEFTSHRWIPRTKASDVELWCFLWFSPE